MDDERAEATASTTRVHRSARGRARTDLPVGCDAVCEVCAIPLSTGLGSREKASVPAGVIMTKNADATLEVVSRFVDSPLGYASIEKNGGGAALRFATRPPRDDE